MAFEGKKQSLFDALEDSGYAECLAKAQAIAGVSGAIPEGKMQAPPLPLHLHPHPAAPPSPCTSTRTLLHHPHPAARLSLCSLCREQAFVFIKPHAVTGATQTLVARSLAEAGVKIYAEGAPG